MYLSFLLARETLNGNAKSKRDIALFSSDQTTIRSNTSFCTKSRIYAINCTFPFTYVDFNGRSNLLDRPCYPILASFDGKLQTLIKTGFSSCS